MFIYIKFFKPFEVMCQFTDQKGRRTLKNYLSVSKVYPVGRLDYRSEGLLLLSDDGKLIHKLTDPRYFHIKKYYAQVEGIPTEKDIYKLNNEIVLPGLQTQLARAKVIVPPALPARSRPVRDYHPTTWLQFELTEGKKHQVRRMTAAIGFPTLRLIRVSIAGLEIGNLKPGEWRYLTNAETSDLLATSVSR